MVELLDSMPTRHVPKQKPGRSKQDYATPANFMKAVADRYGAIDFDLAASEEDRKALRFFDFEEDALAQDWNKLTAKNLWLNPPFAKIAPWAAKCADYHVKGGRIYLLVPASVGSCWFAAHVFGKARVLFLAPRLSFDGKDPYPKDCMLCVYGKGVQPGFEVWDWVANKRTKM